LHDFVCQFRPTFFPRHASLLSRSPRGHHDLGNRP
jgi:hypothetical protein